MTRVRRALGAAALAASVVGLAAPGCSSKDPNYFVKPYDAGQDAEASAEEEAGPNVDPTLGGPCIEDGQCDDKIPCTYDKCDPALMRCRNTPDDTQCDDGVYCNGRERCVLREGCAAGAVVTCEDGAVCTVDRCVEASKSCTHSGRDVDGDGDIDGHCPNGGDCDDTDPTVSSKAAEICGNGKDDNCNGVVDEMPCSRPANDDCSNALAVTKSGTYLLTTVAAKKDYSNSCSVGTPAASRDVVVAITVPGAPGDPAQDVEVWATSETTGDDVAVALESTCGAAGSEIECENVAGAGNARAIAAAVTPGSVVYAIVTAQKESQLDVKVDIHTATPRPTNVGCGAPAAVALDTPFTVSIIDPNPAAGVATSCAAKTGEYTYSFTVPGPNPADVRIFATTLVGTGTPVVSLRDASCTGELRCRVGAAPPLFARNLAPGTYDFTVSGTTQLDASVLVKTYPATVAPANQSCTTAPMAPINSSFLVDLSQNEDAIANGCFPGGPAAAFDLELTQPSDVLVIGRFPLIETGAVSLNEITMASPDCTTSNRLACNKGVTPQRVSKRNLPAGSYRVVVADQQGLTAELSVLVRPTVAPTNLGSTSDGCVGTASIPAGGGFFTGDTSGANADFDAGCDAPGQGIGGARDQLLRLDLAQSQRVVFDMSGSVYATLLDIRSGSTCPGLEVMNACYVGAGPSRSFLDTSLGPGTFWVQIDGYAGDRGAWDLDVRILPP